LQMKPLILPRKYNRLSSQTSGKDIFLKKLLKRKRGLKSPKTILKKYKIILGIIIPLTLLITGVLFAYNTLNQKGYMKIDSVEVTGTEKYVNENDLRKLAEENAYGKNIFLYSTYELQKVLQENFLGAKNITISKILPNKIKIDVSERVPLAVVLSISDKNLYLIDGEGYVLGQVSEAFTGLPRVQYEGKVPVGSFLQKDIVPITLEILGLAEKDELLVSSMSFYPQYTRLDLNLGTILLISNEKSKENSIKSASYLIKKLSLEGKKVRKIDLRYDKVIVSYE